METLTALTVKELYTLDETIAKDIFEGATYPWEVLPKISAFIVELAIRSAKKNTRSAERTSGSQSPPKSHRLHLSTGRRSSAKRRKCATVHLSAAMRSWARGAVVGNSTELKNVILFNKVQVPHYNYVGDSILGYKSHMGAGSITST